MVKFNGNVPNTNLVANLPQGACVEVPVLVLDLNDEEAAKLLALHDPLAGLPISVGVHGRGHGGIGDGILEQGREVWEAPSSALTFETPSRAR